MGREIQTIRETSDRTLHSCPLGLRLWDGVLQSVISEGLHVSAYPEGYPSLRTEAAANPSGVFVFHGLHGLHDFEFRAGEKNWQELDPRPSASNKPFRIEVRDGLRRFLPFLMKVRAPHEKIVAWFDEAAASPDAGKTGVPLFSSPARSVPPGMAAIRAELWDPEQNRPAARALLKAAFKGTELAQGLADDKGRIILIFPYPEPARLQLGSPPRNPGIVPLRDQEWQIDLRFFYTAAGQADDIPDLTAVCNQPPAIMWRDTHLENELVEASLQFGKEAILRTKKAGEPLPVLYVTSAVSPP